MKLLRFLLLICTMQSFGVMAQIIRQQPPRALIDNSSVDGGKKLKFQSEINTQNDKPKKKYIHKLTNPISFCPPPPDPKPYRDRGLTIAKPDCTYVDYFFVLKDSAFDILGDFSTSMDIKEIEKNCKWKGGGEFYCNNKKIENSNSINLLVEYYKNVKAMKLIDITYSTCSPPWKDIKQSIIEKYAPKSYRYIDYSDEEMVGKNTNEEIRFFADAIGESGEYLVVFLKRDVSSCPGGLLLGFHLTSSNFLLFKEESEELYKRISEDTAKKTPAPKF
jgi:hypothetical protein